MDAYEIVRHLNQVLDLCDSLDQSGEIGVIGLTNGKTTSREALRLQLGFFLLYIGGSNGYLTDGETALINVVMDTEYTAQQFKQLLDPTDAPDPASSMIMMGFLSGDMALNQQNGTRSTQLTDVLIQLYEAMANVMIAFDDNPVAHARKAKYISGMKAYVWKHI